MRLISSCYVSIYVVLPVSGERNKNQNYAYVGNQTTDSSLQRTLVSQMKMKYFALNAQTDFFILYVMHTLAHTVHRGK